MKIIIFYIFKLYLIKSVPYFPIYAFLGPPGPVKRQAASYGNTWRLRLLIAFEVRKCYFAFINLTLFLI